MAKKKSSSIAWPDYVLRSIKSGPLPARTNWRDEPQDTWTRGQRMCGFIERYLRLPDGKNVGKPFMLMPADECFILAVYDNPHGTKKAYNSRARKNSKTTLISALVLGHLVGPERVKNSSIYSGAMTKEQAGIVASTAAKMVQQSEMLQKLVRIVPSSKRLVGLSASTEFKSMARDGPAAMGLNGKVVILDEVGSIESEQDDFVDAMTSCTGAWDDAIIFAISTSAASDSALYSRWLDDAERANDPTIVSHVYKADEDCDLLDEKQWQYANPGLHISRSYEDLKSQLIEASRLPSKEANARVLLLNQRVQMNHAWLAPSVWKANGKPYDMNVFRRFGVSIGLDLSRVDDLCCACISAKDPDTEEIHVKLYSFSPLDGIELRSMKHRVPFDRWAKEGHIYAPPGKTLDYDMVAQWLKIELEREEIEVNEINFDRWGSAAFFAACDRQGFAMTARRNEVGQGYVSISPRIAAAETVLLKEKLRHGNNQPVLNMGAASCVVITDPALNRKLDRMKSSQKIDGIISMLMSIYSAAASVEQELSIESMIG